MGLLKQIKHSGLDIFLLYHPTVIKIKKEAKNLHKEQKNSNNSLSLMQCQEKIISQYGFNSWHHFIQTLKNQYNQDSNTKLLLDNLPLITTNKYENIQNKYYLGYDFISNNYKYQDNASSLTHRLIVGADIYDKYDVFLAQQSIKLGEGVFFIDGDNNSNTFNKLIDCAKQYNREKDIILISPSNEHFYDDFNFFSSSNLTELFFSLWKHHYFQEIDNKFINFYISYLNCFFIYIKYIYENKTLTLLNIKSKFNINFLNYEIASSYTQDLQNNLKTEIDENNLHSIVDHLTITMHNIIDNLYASGIFSQKENAHSFSSIYDNSLIYLINQNTLNTYFITLLLKSNLTIALGVSIFKTETPTKKRKKFTIYFRNVEIVQGMAVIPAQARSLNISFSISFKTLNQIINNPELLSIIANTNTKIISPTEHTLIDLLTNQLDLKIETTNSNLNNQNTLKYIYLIYRYKTFKLYNDSFYFDKIN